MGSQSRNNIKRDKTYAGYITFNKQAKSSFLISFMYERMFFNLALAFNTRRRSRR